MRRILLLTCYLILTINGMTQNQFAFKLHEQMDQRDNLLFSPISIKVAFAMVYEGANGDTKKEFESIFGFQPNNQVFINEIKALKRVAKISNSIWIQESFKVLDSYLETVRKNFGSSPQFTDFLNNPKGSSDKINQWIEKSTNGMIKKMLKPQMVKSFKLALVNAIYFKKDWLNKFDQKQTELDQDFHNMNGAKSKVDLMFTHHYFKALDSKQEKVIELPYKGQQTSMIVIMPEKMDRYKLDEKKYNSLVNRLHNQEVKFHFPTFEFETPTFELIDDLMKMGMTRTFSDFADFSGIREEKDLKVGAALHKAKIIINEEGTEAAAATVISMVTTSTSSTQPRRVMEMRVDQPFYYFIRDNKTNTILFLGQMTNFK